MYYYGFLFWSEIKPPYPIPFPKLKSLDMISLLIALSSLIIKYGFLSFKRFLELLELLLLESFLVLLFPKF